MSTIRERNGKHHVQVRLAGFPAQSASFDRKTDAKAWAAKTETAMRDGRHFPSREAKRHTLAELVDRRLAEIERKQPHALGKQRQLLGWWKDQLGDYALAHIGPEKIAEKRDALLAENVGTAEEPRYRGPATAKRYLAALSKTCSMAVKEYRWLERNPVQQVSKPTEPDGIVRYLSDEERVRLIEACKGSALHELELIVLLAITTGMRRGEIMGLRWADLDLKRCQAVLHKTKNKTKRAVPLMPQVLVLLQTHAKVRRLDTDLVFPLPGRDKPLDPARPFQTVLKKAKIDSFRFHDLRHTAASYLAMSGATLPEIAAVLGHKTFAMVKRYAHLSDQHTSAVVGRMTEKYFGSAAA
ncbi:MAG: site-specific integrase [Burkholderiales bacterium]